MVLKIWSPVGGSLGSLLRYGFAGGIPVEVGFEVSKNSYHFKFVLSASYFLSSVMCHGLGVLSQQ